MDLLCCSTVYNGCLGNSTKQGESNFKLRFPWRHIHLLHPELIGCWHVSHISSQFSYFISFFWQIQMAVLDCSPISSPKLRLGHQKKQLGETSLIPFFTMLCASLQLKLLAVCVFACIFFVWHHWNSCEGRRPGRRCSLDTLYAFTLIFTGILFFPPTIL